MIYFIGAGPGDPELLTIKAKSIIQQAKVIIYAGSLVNKKVLKYAARSALIYDSSKMTLEQVLAVFSQAQKAKKIVARIHSGDPSLYGAIQEQINWCKENKIPCAVIPGVSSFCAAAASLKQELTLPEISQTVIITRLSGRTKVPPKENLKALSRIRATLIIFLSIQNIKEVVAKLLSGYAKTTPIAVVYKASWPSELIIRATLGDIVKKIKPAGIKRQALVIVGDVLKQSGFAQSRLYAKEFTHGYRKSS